MKKTRFLIKILPLSLLGVLLLVMLVTLFTQATSASLTTDEGLRMDYGLSVYRWYDSLGKDQVFLNYPKSEYEPEHGVLFDAFVAGVVQVLHTNRWATEAICIGLAGILGVVAIALCGFELGGWWFALLAALSLWLYPRYFGAIFNNPKDIPFATASTFLLWSVLVLMRQWQDHQKTLRNSLGVAFFLALAVAIRVNGILWYAILALLLAGWWLFHFQQVKRAKQLFQTIEHHINASVTIGIVSFLGIMAMWPYIFINPFEDLSESIKIIANYPWNGSVLYQGQNQLAVDLPRSYALVWLVIGSPPALILLTVLGLLFLCVWCVRKRAIDPQMTIVTLAFVLPLASIVLLHSELYNALRQFIFLVPPMILLAVYALTRMFVFFWQRKQKVLLGVLVLLTVANFTWITKDMLELHPYEYVYFSPLVGGVQGAYGQYEMDYWNSCERPASEWLAQNYQHYTTSQRPTIQGSPFQFQYMTFLPTNFHAVVTNPNFFIDDGTFKSPQQLAHYRLIHTVSIENVPLCRVYVSSSAG
ncbi:MAG TPA: hypothetical protein VGM01_07675 [Ktedonobacteraceae bacterium]